MTNTAHSNCTTPEAVYACLHSCRVCLISNYACHVLSVALRGDASLGMPRFRAYHAACGPPRCGHLQGLKKSGYTDICDVARVQQDEWVFPTFCELVWC